MTLLHLKALRLVLSHLGVITLHHTVDVLLNRGVLSLAGKTHGMGESSLLVGAVVTSRQSSNGSIQFQLRQERHSQQVALPAVLNSAITNAGTVNLLQGNRDVVAALVGLNRWLDGPEIDERIDRHGRVLAIRQFAAA